MAPDADQKHHLQGRLTLHRDGDDTENDDDITEDQCEEEAILLPPSLKDCSRSTKIGLSRGDTAITSSSRSVCSSTSSTCEDASLECVLQPRFLTDFSYMEKPVRFTLSCQGKQLTTNGKSALFMTTAGSSTSSTRTSTPDEFTLLPQPNGTVQMQSTKTHRFLCSNPESGGVYASETCYDGLEEWMLTSSTTAARGSDGGGGTLFLLSSVASGGRRYLACVGDTICTVDNHETENILWSVHFTTGEVCSLSLTFNDNNIANDGSSNNSHGNSHNKLQLGCDLFGKLSLSKNYPGWGAWRLCEVPSYSHPGCIRISSWAHSDYYLASNEEGDVFTTTNTTTTNEGPPTSSSSMSIENVETLWSVERAPRGLDGVLIKSCANGQVLHWHRESKSFGTIPGDAYLLNESSVWDIQAVHRQTYYLVSTTSTNSSTWSSFTKRLEAARRGITTRSLPGRLSSEEWTIQPTSNADEYGVVALFSNGRQQYLGSDAAGEVFLADSSCGGNDDSCKWLVEDREEEGFVIQSHAMGRILVVPDRGSICTVEAGTTLQGNTRWKLEPKLPPQVNKKKMQAVGAAVAIGVVGTVATPFVIGGAIGMMGVAEVGLAGHIAIGSIRAAEAVNTITRVTLSSSQLLSSQSSFLEAPSESSRYNDASKDATASRPFCSWRSW